ncbi:MAG: LysE family transporter [Mariniphaga sp.]
MTLMRLWEGFMIGMAVSIPLGPLGMLCIKRTVNKNWKSGFLSGLGIAASDAIYAIIAGFSLTIIIDFINSYEIYFKILGASMVIFLGLYIFLSNPAKEIQKFKQKGTSYLQDFLTAFLLTVTNPLSVFVFIAIFTSYSLVLQPSHPIEALMIVGGIFSGGATWWFIITGLAFLFKHKLTIDTLWWANKIIGLGVILIAVGLFILLLLKEI